MESGGRAVLGLGRGDSALRLIGESPAGISSLEAGLRSVRAYLRGETVGADGPSARLTWLPDDLPSVPVDVAASGPATIALGATVADRLTFNLGADASLLGWGVSLARRAHEPRRLGPGRDRPRCVRQRLVRPRPGHGGLDGAGSASIFIRFVAEAMAHGVPVGGEDRAIVEAVEHAYQEAAHGLASSEQAERGTRRLPRAVHPRRTRSELVDRLAGLSELGLQRIVVVPASRDADPSFVAGSTARFADEVIPHLRH